MDFGTALTSATNLLLVVFLGFLDGGTCIDYKFGTCIIYKLGHWGAYLIFDFNTSRKLHTVCKITLYIKSKDNFNQ